MEAARTSETLVNFYQTTRCYNPEDSNLHTHRRENLKSYEVYVRQTWVVTQENPMTKVYESKGLRRKCGGKRWNNKENEKTA
jgi:hypothetical protein